MQRLKQDQIEWLEFDLLADFPHVKHSVFLRHGGCSEGVFASLNTGLYVTDRPEHVQENLRRIKALLQQQMPEWKSVVWSRASHGKTIVLVDAHTPEEILDFDGIMTATPHVTLLMKHADCQIGLFYDPKNHVAANVHAGWRGSVANIFGRTVEKMKQTFGTHPADLLVCISPSLGPDEAEFMHYRSEIPEEYWHFQVRPTYFDFWAITEFQLQAAGVLPHHIEIARLSTYANARDFFSHRRDKTTGRHATCLTLL